MPYANLSSFHSVLYYVLFTSGEVERHRYSLSFRLNINGSIWVINYLIYPNTVVRLKNKLKRSKVCRIEIYDGTSKRDA
jgi:hypothetical protein